MKRIVLILMILTAVLTGCNQNMKANEEGLTDFLVGLKGLEYEMVKYFEEYPEGDDEFLKQIYNDFLNGKIEFISPDYETDNLDDPEFQRYTNKYPELNFEYGYLLNNGELTDITQAHYNFKVYQIDFDNNKSNGKEDVIYSSGYWNEEIIEDKGLYDILNDSSKKKQPYYNYEGWLDGQNVKVEYVGKGKERTNNFNGIMEYKNRYYIYEVWNRNSRKTIRFYFWNKILDKVNCFVIYRMDLKEEK